MFESHFCCVLTHNTKNTRVALPDAQRQSFFSLSKTWWRDEKTDERHTKLFQLLLEYLLVMSIECSQKCNFIIKFRLEYGLNMRTVCVLLLCMCDFMPRCYVYLSQFSPSISLKMVPNDFIKCAPACYFSHWYAFYIISSLILPHFSSLSVSLLRAHSFSLHMPNLGSHFSRIRQNVLFNLVLLLYFCVIFISIQATDAIN